MDLGLLLVGGGVAVALAAAFPQRAVVVAVLVAVFPGIEVAPAVGVLLAVTLGVGLRYLGRLGELGRPAVLLAALVVLLLVTTAINPTPRFLGADVARNHLIASLAPMVFAFAVGLAQVPARTIRAALASAGGVASVWLIVMSEGTTTGRLRTEELNENVVGYIGALTVVSALACWTIRPNLLCGLGALVGAVPLVLSQSRGALVAMVVGLFALWVSQQRSSWRGLIMMFAPVAVFVVWPLVVGTTQFYFSRRSAVGDDGTYRLDLAQLAVQSVRESPLTGIGWRGFPDVSLIALGRASNTHNEYLRVAVEAGLPALLLMLAVGWMVLRSRAQAQDKAILLAGAVAFGFNNAMSNPSVALFVWVPLAVCLWSNTTKQELGKGWTASDDVLHPPIRR